VRPDPGAEQQVYWPFAQYLIGDVALAGADIAGFGNGGHWVSAGIMAGLSATLLLMPTIE
jgi:hypothetical protein